MAEPVVLITAFEASAASAEAFVAAWERTRDYLKTQPGYVDTALHQALTPDAEFLFVNVVGWRTAEDFLTATRSQGFAEAAAGIPQSQSHPALHRVVRNWPRVVEAGGVHAEQVIAGRPTQKERAPLAIASTSPPASWTYFGFH